LISPVEFIGVARIFLKKLTTFFSRHPRNTAKSTEWTTPALQTPPPSKTCPEIDYCSAWGYTVHLQIFHVNYA